MPEALWSPSEAQRTRSAMALFQKHVEQKLGRKFISYRDFHSWSVTSPLQFWDWLSDFVGIRWITPPKSSGKRIKEGMRGMQWFPGSTLNYAANLLPEATEEEVLICYAEGTERRSLTGLALRNAVARCAESLRKLGVQEYDVVAGVLSNGPEAIVGMLAAASLGAVWSSCSPDFGTSGVYDRLSQVKPKVVFFTRQYQYNGKVIRSVDAISDALERIHPDPALIACDHLSPQDDEFWKFCGGWDNLGRGETRLEFMPRGFDAPLYIMFSSGTTGLPKCMVHSVGGTLLQLKKELMLHSDLQAKDTLFYFTTCGWMMWNWMVAGLSCGSRIVTFDGAPTYPNLETLWNIVGQEQVTHFGTSPKFLSACMQNSEFSPTRQTNISQLRTILSTGSPLLPAHFDWVYRWFPDIHLASISGGTDIISCFMLGNPTLPVYSGEIQGAGLGMAVEAWDSQAKPVYGKKGELVCVAPFVSMPVSFLDDPDGSRYQKAYFDQYRHKEVWRHGDFIEITEHGGIIVYGRSDATLNPGGVRIGTAEIYRTVETLPFVLDSLAVGQNHKDDTRIILFVKLQPGISWSEEEHGKVIKNKIRSDLTPRHVPSLVIPVADIPYTRSGKKVEIAVTQILHGETVPNLSALTNQECLKEYEDLRRHLVQT